MNPCTEINNNFLNVIEEIQWLPQNICWIRLNTEGASKHGMIAGCGGVFPKGLGACSAYVAELWRVFE